MKRIVIYLMAVIQLIACDSLLDVEPETMLTYTNSFKTEKDVAALLYDINAKLYRSLCYDDRAHQMVGLIADKINDQPIGNTRNLVPSEYQYISWNGYYTLIYSANVILDNAYRFKEVEAERLEYYKRQACFVKAFCYFQIARQWGDAPIVSNSTTVAVYPREKVIKVLDEAIRNAEIALELPKFEDLVDETGAKITSKQYGSKGAATALLAHIYAWRAGLLGEATSWEMAEKYCSDIIEGKVGYYELAKDPKEVCVSVMKGNSPEGIFEAEYYMPDDPFFMHKPYLAVYTYLTYPIIKGQLPTARTYLEIHKRTVKEMYDREHDRRIDAYFREIDSNVYHIKDPYNPAITHEVAIEKAFLGKWDYPVYEYNAYLDRELYKTQDVNRIVWRLADIMLLRAECRIRLNRGNAADDLNEIRGRAYGNREHDYTAAEGDLRYMIFKEREKELLFEGHRYYDVIRNGYWKTELTDAFSIMSEEEFETGAQYYPVAPNSFYRNDLMQQNQYWQSKGLK